MTQLDELACLVLLSRTEFTEVGNAINYLMDENEKGQKIHFFILKESSNGACFLCNEKIENHKEHEDLLIIEPEITLNLPLLK